ncbi:MAG: FG-GAP-like repeat-containing protein [Bacteroidia bacterium]|nr:FG-GAP-like repeat-containing protein [Bacteroidia bacterium]
MKLAFRLLIASLFLATSCSPKGDKYSLVWNTSFPTLGTSSSIKCADLTGDGILDVVIGAGKNEFQDSDSAVIALDGKTGKILWTIGGVDQIVGSASFLDINEDGTEDVIIGGRSAQLLAIDGKRGKEIWRFKKDSYQGPAAKFLRFNFYNSQFIPDQDGDGLQDLLLANGGNVNAAPNSEKDRYPAVLAVMSSATGEVLAADTMPDGKESYMSPLLYQFEEEGDLKVIFGTGGETIGGSLYILSLDDLMKSDISGAMALYKEAEHGYIAPPVLADINNDGIKEIISISHNGRYGVHDSRTGRLLSFHVFQDLEANTSPCPGYFNEDEYLDIFLSMSEGVWPQNTGQKQFIISGKDGKILWEKNLGCCGYSSPLSYDVDGDGYQEAVWTVNEYNCDGLYAADGQHYLFYKDLNHAREEIMSPKIAGKNIGSTPWLGDLDGDGFLDILYCMQANTSVIHQYFGFMIVRSKTRIPVSAKNNWGQYMGPEGKGIY